MLIQPRPLHSNSFPEVIGVRDSKRSLPWRRALAPYAAALALLLIPPITLAGELLPDIKTLPPTEISLEISETGRHLLRFTQAFTNLGPGVLRVRGVLPEGEEEVAKGYQEILDEEGNVVRSLPIPSVIFHPHHKHWHAGDIAAYQLRLGSPWGPLVAQNGKISYCLVDQEPSPDYTGKYHPPTYVNCETATQGISPGWVDTYTADLHDQWVDVTGVGDGVYYLVVHGDPERVYTEADDGDRANNTAWARVELFDGGRQVRVMAEEEILLRVNGERLDLPAYPRLVSGRAVAHVRLAEHLGARVEWDGTKVIITRAGKRLEITPGRSGALVDGRPVAMGAEALMEEGRVLVPVRFLCEELGATVEYDWLASTMEIRQE